MDCTNDCATFSRQIVQQLYAVRWWWTVQTTAQMGGKQMKRSIKWNLIIGIINMLIFFIVIYLVGSSKKSTCRLSSNSNAIDNRFRWPPDKLPHFVYFERINCKVFNTLSIYKVKEESQIYANGMEWNEWEEWGMKRSLWCFGLNCIFLT